jgi:hypothetical protein
VALAMAVGLPIFVLWRSLLFCHFYQHINLQFYLFPKAFLPTKQSLFHQILQKSKFIKPIVLFFPTTSIVWATIQVDPSNPDMLPSQRF